MFFGLYILLINSKVYVFEWLIFRLNSIKFNSTLVISFRLIMFMFLVILISRIILIYGIRYMDLNNEYLINRLYYLTFLFFISIIFSISRPNVLNLLSGRDGLTLIIYYQKIKSFNSGILSYFKSMGWFKFINNYFFYNNFSKTKSHI